MSLARFGVRNPVVANLVMFAIIGAGVLFGITLRREFFPEIEPTLVAVTAPYPGAAPDEVEDALVVKIEDQLADVDGLKEIRSTVSEGGAGVVLEFVDGTNIDEAVAEVKREIDALQDLPEQSERITVQKIEPQLPVIIVAVYGDSDERALKEVIRGVEDDLKSLPGMGETQVGGIRTDEVSVEVQPAAMIEYGLSLPDIADRIRAAMIEMPAGAVRSPTQTVRVRSLGVDERADAVRNIVVLAGGNGRVVRLSDIATVRDAFEDVDLRVRFDGKPTVSVTVSKKGDQDIVKMAEIVKAYVKGRRGEPLEMTLGERIASAMMPPGSDQPPSARVQAYRLGLERGPVPGQISTTTDLARFVVGRLELLTRNALSGGLLVFATLVLLLNWRVSFWVVLGLVVSLLGTLVVMRILGITLNLLTMFGLIIVVGMLVDDAIVVAENITTEHERGMPPKQAAVEGTDLVAWPVVATVLTTIFAFLPLALIQGNIGDFMKTLPIVVSCALSVSLLEALFILPSHMAHTLKVQDERPNGFVRRTLGAVESKFDRARDGLFGRIIIPGYARMLRYSLKYRYIFVAAVLMLVLASIGLVVGGRVQFIFFEANDAETLNVELQMPVGTPMEETDTYVRKIEEVVKRQPEVATVFSITGEIGDLSGGEGGMSNGNVAQLILELQPVEVRTQNNMRSSDELIVDIRKELGPMPGIKSLRMEGISGGPSGPALSFTVVGPDEQQIDEAVERIQHRMGEFVGVFDIATDVNAGQRELRFELRDGARELGFTRANLGRQIQGTVFGIKAYTFPGHREDVDVRVIAPERVRRSQEALEDMFVFTPDGRPVPIGEVAHIYEGEAYSTIRRLDRQRAVTVTADVDRSTGANPETIAATMDPFLRQIERDLPGIRVLKRGRQEDLQESMSTLPVGMLVALALIYVTLAWLFRSYLQPLIVMTAIPFATIGMIWGHVLLGYSLTFLSLIGFVALAGVVVNDSLIYMDFFNIERRRGLGVAAAAISAGRARVRAILLTTITTVLGLLPLLMAQSFQARFLIPMAITISGGLISATIIILIVLPSLLLILDDCRRVLRSLWTGQWTPPPDPTEVRLVRVGQTQGHTDSIGGANGQSERETTPHDVKL